MIITRLTTLHKPCRRAILGSPGLFKRQALKMHIFFNKLAITRHWRFVATAFRKKVGLIISTKSNLAVCVLIIFFNM